ncbi:MAG: histidinol-phosphatase [Parachlamydiales bacterium]|nr:histidinol-phosphatase [Parachlamydiales bacterium]
MKYSYHVHSTFSDGKVSIAKIIEHAKILGLDEVGISDHFHISVDDILIPCDMELNEFDNYINEIVSYEKQTNPKVKLGLEIEFVFETMDQLKKILFQKPLDYIIGSVHMINNKIIDSSIDSLPSNFCTDIVKEYWIKIRQMAECKFFDIVGHMDLTKKFNLKPKIDISKEIDAALNAIKEADMTVEVNTSGFYYPCKEQFPSTHLLKKCKKLGIPIIVTADAHLPEHLTRDFDKAFKLLKEIGYSKLAYFTKRKRFFTPLE